MASHTPGELRAAARTLGEAARRAGIEPQDLLAPAPEPPQEVQEVETALGRAQRLAAEQSGVGAMGATPFDFEREGPATDSEPAAAPSLAEELAVIGRRIDESGPAAAAGAPTQLFDGERAEAA
jgi:hypothetical protein